MNKQLQKREPTESRVAGRGEGASAKRFFLNLIHASDFGAGVNMKFYRNIIEIQLKYNGNSIVLSAIEFLLNFAKRISTEFLFRFFQLPRRYAVMLAMLLVLFPADVNALTISPPLREFSVDPGETIRGQAVIGNDENRVLQIEILTKNFEAGDEDGAPRWSNIPGDLAGWIKFSNQKFTLVPGTSKKLDYEIVIPKDASPGGHFAGIIAKASMASERGASGATLVNEISTLFLARVSGEVIESGEVKEFFLESIKPGTLPIKFSARFLNSGNVFLKPYGTIKISSWSGKQIAELAINDQGGNVLPQSGRRFDALWEDKDWRAGVKKLYFGKYRASLEMFYGSDNIKEIRKIDFWLVNRGGLLAAFVALVLGGLIIWRVVKKIRGKRFFVERI